MTNAPRSLDHLVLPVLSLDVARARLAALGFTCAPDGIHPFGTVNACVFFSDGTFLEPLAIGDAVVAEQTAREGNAFTAGDARFRTTVGDNGFSALVLGSGDADADDASFRAAGFGGGSRLDFSRAFRTPDGAGGEASFRLAFAAPQPDNAAFFFTCQRVNVPAVDRSALESHVNGVTGIRGVELRAGNPSRHRGFLERFTGGAATGDDACIRVALANATIVTGRDAAAQGLVCHAVRFACRDLSLLRTRLDEAGIVSKSADGNVIVPPAPGQGATFIIEE
ncbi:MAG: lactoylglutathione lyase [Phyllobacteriaceae bacterium]|nr:lactoylglutathione lyase [Phyllobacteriaceae bacterium]MBA89820.1 lactoylglutathione lyase [Phyllobacteriaceae bacterium]